MVVFQNDGHLTDQALRALTEGMELPELTRLEMAEHLSFCDQCLQRYADLLAAQPLPEVPLPCREGILRRIRLRAARIFVNRYAAAAAAVALAVTALWTTGPLEPGAVRNPGEPTAITRTLRSWPAALNREMERHFSRLTDVFDFFGGADDQAPNLPQGGIE